MIPATKEKFKELSQINFQLFDQPLTFGRPLQQ